MIPRVLLINHFRLLSFLLLYVLSAGSSFAQDGGASLSLNDCIAKALKSHPQLGIYEHRLNQQKEKLSSVKADYLPRLGATASYDRLSYVTQSKQRYLDGSSNDYQADVTVTQPLYTGGKLGSEKNFARFAINSAEQGYSVAREEVVLGVKTAYFRLLFAQDILKSKNELFEYTESAYKTAFDLNKRTKMPREETLLRLEVQLNEVRHELIAAQAGQEIARKSLLNAMGVYSAGSIEVQTVEDTLVLDEVLNADFENPEILRITEDLKGAGEQIKAARSGFYPQVKARYSYGHEWSDLPGGDNDWIAGVAVDLNIWDWGKTKAEVKQAKAFQNELKSVEALLKQQIGLELDSARLEFESAVNRLKIAQSNCEQSKKSLEMFSNRYKDSLVTSIELLDAQKAFSQAQVNCASTKLDMRLAKARIEQITGRGYDNK